MSQREVNLRCQKSTNTCGFLYVNNFQKGGRLHNLKIFPLTITRITKNHYRVWAVIQPLSRKVKNTKLNRRQNGLMALEQRFMFDGAAVDTTINLKDGDLTLTKTEDSVNVNIFEGSANIEKNKKYIIHYTKQHDN